MIAATLYGNIGLKVAYINVVEDIFKGPPLRSRMGRILWTILVPIYWSIGFIIGSSIPALGAMTGLVGSVCIFHFTYTFPPLMLLWYQVRHDAAIEDVKFDGHGSPVSQKDTFRQMSRWRRGFGGKYWLLKIFALGLFLAALACDGLGLWGTGEAVKEALSVGAATSFGCAANA